jgi:hypothetical protein
MEFADAISRRATHHPTFVESAKQILKRLAEKYPDVAAILVEQAKISRIGNTQHGLEEAYALTTKAIQLDGAYPRALFNRACYASLLASRADSLDKNSIRASFVNGALHDVRSALTLDRAWCSWVLEDNDLEYLRALPDFETITVEFGLTPRSPSRPA